MNRTARLMKVSCALLAAGLLGTSLTFGAERANDPIAVPPPELYPDLDGDGAVSASDLAILLVSWGPCPDTPDCPADLDLDSIVGPSDLAVMLSEWTGDAGPSEG